MKVRIRLETRVIDGESCPLPVVRLRVRDRYGAWAELKFLLNHSVAGMGVTGGYLHLGLAHLRDMQARASAAILDRIGLEHRSGSWPPTVRPDERLGTADETALTSTA